MKKTLITLLIVALSGTTVFAQGRNPGQGQGRGQTAVESKSEQVEAEGILVVLNGRIALKTSDKSYYVWGFQQLIGFVEGLKEGVAVKIIGQTRELPLAPEYALLRAEQLIFNGKTYELSPTGIGARSGFEGSGQRRQGREQLSRSERRNRRAK